MRSDRPAPSAIPVVPDGADTLADVLATAHGRGCLPLYLGGPADQHPDGENAVRATVARRCRQQDVPVVDPLALWPDYRPDPQTAIAGCLVAASACEVLLCGMGVAPTFGTGREVERALAAGNRVVCHRAEPGVSNFVTEDPAIPVYDDLDAALGALRPALVDGRCRP